MRISYIDIAFSQIKRIDLFECIHLEGVAADKSQKIEAEIGVAVEYIYDTSDFIDSEMVSLGIAVENTLGNSLLVFE